MNALRVLATAVRGVAATMPDRDIRDKIMDCATEVMDRSASLIEEVRKVANDPQNPENNNRLAQVSQLFNPMIVHVTENVLSVLLLLKLYFARHKCAISVCK